MVEGLTSRIQRYPLCESVCEATWHSGMTYVSTWFRSWKEIHFVLMEKKRQKAKMAFGAGFATVVREAARARGGRGAAPSSFPGNLR